MRRVKPGTGSLSAGLVASRLRLDNPDVAGPDIRASDAERELALARLRDGFAEGRLTHETFTHRVDEVLRARANGELLSLVADLPRPHRLRVAMLAAAVIAAGRRAMRAADRWLRGWPPVLTLPVVTTTVGSRDRFTIGREPACDMTLADESVSRWHASLELCGGGWLLTDLGSTNGTRLNGWRVTGQMPVRPGDMVSFGATTFVLSDRPR
jgi:Domain of unknown function (DUF1707)/Inner membrane component of T3SS, cytoplasmic domain